MRERVYCDTASGKIPERTELAKALDALRPDVGDMFVVWKLDCLGLSVKALVDLVGRFDRDGVESVSLADGIDTSTPAGRT